MYILGISSFYHDSAAVLIKDGVIVCAIEEERLSRIKHDNSFPFSAIQKCLEFGGITINDVSIIGYYEKPLLKFERILDRIVQEYPFSLKQFTQAIPEWIGHKIAIERIIKSKLKFKGKLFYIPHHLSHAAAAFYSSGFDRSAILTADGVGEYQTTGLWVGEKNQIRPINSLNYPHSLGLFYSLFTSFLGFKVNEDEYKLMGLSAYGKAKYIIQIFQIIDLKSDGSFRIKDGYFNFNNFHKPWTSKFEKLFGHAKKSTDPFSQRHKDIAASIQAVLEEIYFKMLNHLYKLSNTKNLCIGGGVGLNAVANGKIHQKTPFKNISIIGSSGDSGGALGAALYIWHFILKKEYRTRLNSLSLGTAYKVDEIQSYLDNRNLSYRRIKSETELIAKTVQYLKKGKLVGWFQGQMEFGPRALGARSILANPQNPDMKRKINLIKGRELFRPFGGSVLQEKAYIIFEIPFNYTFPFMNFCFKVRQNKIHKISSIVHVDSTSRIQTVSVTNGLYYRLIKKFYQQTGIPCILNTSFNLAGEPLVETPHQAVEDFLKTSLDYLIIGPFILTK